MSSPVTSMMPAVEVEPPSFEPYRYGLLSAAEVYTGAGRWELGGVAYTTAGCPNRTSEWATLCPPTTPLPEKDMPTGLNEVSGKPFQLYDAVACYPQSGRSLDELIVLSEQNLIAGEQEKVEEKFWAALRARASVVQPPSPDTSWGLCSGLGMLEQLIAQQYGGIGVVHAPRPLITSARTVVLSRYPDGGGDEVPRVRTPGDNLWAFGAGYDRKGPPLPGNDDNEAPAGQMWIYATGPVVLRRSEVQNHPSFDRTSNENRALSERSYVLTAECPALAVLIRVPEC